MAATRRHVGASRALYREKFALADRVLGNMPGYRARRAGSSCGSASATARRRRSGFTARRVRVLPGAYLGRETGTARIRAADYIRVALVAAPEAVERGLVAIRETLSATTEERSDRWRAKHQGGPARP